MPGKKTNAGPIDQKIQKRISVASIRRVWKDITPDQWLAYVKNAAGAQNWVRKGGRIMGLCPFHDEKSPSFTIDLEKQYAKCFGCQKFFWNPISFVAALKTAAGKATTYIDAMVDLKDTYDLKDFKKTVMEGLSRQWRRRMMKKVLHLVTNAELCEAAKLMDRIGFAAACDDQRYGYAVRTVRYFDYRGIPRKADHWYDQLPIGVLMPELRLEQEFKARAEKEGLDKNQLWDMVKEYLEPYFANVSMWQGAMLFFTGNTPDLPSHVKIRATPMLLANGVFSTEDAKLVQWIKDDSEEHRGMFMLYGAPPYGRLIDAQSQKHFMIVEGEFDALSIAARQFEHAPQSIGFICFGGGGGAVDSLDYLKEFGFETAFVIGDNDPGGNEFVKSALERTFHMGVRIFIWPEALMVPGQTKTDPDDAIKAFGLDSVQAAMRDPKNYAFAYQWAKEQALQELIGVDPMDVAQLTNRAAKWGVYVRDTAEQQSYVEAIQRAHPTVNVGMVLSKMVSSDEHEEAFIERIHNVLSARLSVIDYVHEGNSSLLRVFDRITDMLYDLPLNEPKRLVAQIAALSRGKDIYQFIRYEVGEPSFMMSYAEGVASGEQFYLKHSKELEGYVQAAVQRLTGALPLMAQVKHVSAGTHVIVPEDGQEDGIILYAVKGMSLFKGVYENGCDTPIWRKCPGPSDGNVVVYAAHGHRPLDAYPLYHTEDDFNRTPRLTFRELYNLIYRMLDVGWRFKHHENTCHFLTAFIIQFFIADAFPRQPRIMITAEHSSGKTFLIGGLIGRGSQASINIVQPALWMDNYTVAGVRQVMNHSTICLCLDEFENKGLTHDKKSQTVENLNQHFRGSANEAGATVQGSVSGQAVSFRVHHPVVFAGIRQGQDATDLSRTVTIEMDRQQGRPTPEVLLNERLGMDTIKLVREDAPLVAWRELRAIRRAYAEVAERYKFGANVEFSELTRSREHYYGAVAIMKHAGQDYDTLFREHFRLNRTYLSRIAHSSLSGDIFSTIVSVPAIQMPDSGNNIKLPVMAILSSSTPRNLNFSNSGCYYDEELKALVVNFALARFTILANIPEYYVHTSSWLKVHAMRSPYYINDEKFIQSGALDRLLPHMTHSAKMDDVAAFNVSHYLTDAAHSRIPSHVHGLEDFDLSEQFAEALKNIKFPEPPPLLQGKKEAAAGTRRGHDAADSAPRKGVEDEQFNY
jgi:hypothetical protein